MQAAPYHADLADGPKDAAAYWVSAADGVRLRVGALASGAKGGTVLLFPGRTEYVEKYGRAARDFERLGYASLIIDWRGQGLSDRLLGDRMSGHVPDFHDYQRDVAAMIEAAETLRLPKPFHLLAHSMGGAIGLRAVLDGLPVVSCAFSAPMWGIQLSDILRVVAWSVSWGSRRIGMDHVYAPSSTATESYVLVEPFETNKLTRDREMYQYMIDQTLACPALGLGGPSLRWLHEALRETRALSRRAAPDLPCYTFAGTDEQIVDLERINHRMRHWPGAQMDWVEGGRHELMMDLPATRARVFEALGRFFDSHGGLEHAVSRPA